MRTVFWVVNLVVLAVAHSAFAAEPLPSWNDRTSKQAIVAFVKTVTEKSSKDFVPAVERIAVFDNDGTLWSEQPIYVQFAFAFDRIKELAPKNPEWRFADAAIHGGGSRRAADADRAP